MSDVAIIGLESPAKRVFQLHGSKADRSVASPLQVAEGSRLGFPRISTALRCRDGSLRQRPRLGAEIAKLGHSVRLIPPIYVKPLKRQKNDATDAEAIAEAASRPTDVLCHREVPRAAACASVLVVPGTFSCASEPT